MRMHERGQPIPIHDESSQHSHPTSSDCPTSSPRTAVPSAGLHRRSGSSPNCARVDYRGLQTSCWGRYFSFTPTQIVHCRFSSCPTCAKRFGPEAQVDEQATGNHWRLLYLFLWYMAIDCISATDEGTSQYKIGAIRDLLLDFSHDDLAWDSGTRLLLSAAVYALEGSKIDMDHSTDERYRRLRDTCT
jgi:hypothetical protein